MTQLINHSNNTFSQKKIIHFTSFLIEKTVRRIKHPKENPKS